MGRKQGGIIMQNIQPVYYGAELMAQQIAEKNISPMTNESGQKIISLKLKMNINIHRSKTTSNQITPHHG